MQFFTTILTSGSISINSVDSVSSISIQANDTSECQVLGNYPFKGITPSAVSLSNGEILTLSSSSPSQTLDGLTITWVSGTIDIIVGF